MIAVAAENRAKWVQIVQAESSEAAAPAATKAMARRTTAFNEVLMPMVAAATATQGQLDSADSEETKLRGLNALQTFVLAQGGCGFVSSVVVWSIL
jgi:hypothetical protein